MNNIIVPSDEWININTLSGIDVGDYFLLTNNSSPCVRFQITPTKPLDENKDGYPLCTDKTIEIASGSDTVWAKASYGLGYIYPQTVPNITPFQGFPQDILTTNEAGVRRLAVDSQQTSFEQNTQFRYFDELRDIAYTDQVVYKLIFSNPLNLYLRRLALWQGGRSYEVYSDAQVTFGGTLEDSGVISPINQNLNKNITVLPTTGVSIQRSVGTGIITINNDPSTGSPYTPFDGLISLTDGNANRASSELDAEGDKLGYTGGQTVWAVLNPIGANNETNGFFKLKWEELFS